MHASLMMQAVVAKLQVAYIFLTGSTSCPKGQYRRAFGKIRPILSRGDHLVFSQIFRYLRSAGTWILFAVIVGSVSVAAANPSRS